MTKLNLLFTMFIVCIYGHRYFVKHVEKCHYLITLVWSWITQKNLQSCTNPICLHFTKYPAFLTFNAIQYLGNVVNILLVLFHMRVVRFEEFQSLLFLIRKIKSLHFFQKLYQVPFSLHIFSNIIRLNSKVVLQIRSSSNNSLPKHFIQKHQIPNSLRMIQHSPLILRMIKMKLIMLNSSPQISPSTLLNTILIKPTQMSRNTSMQPTDNIEQYLLLQTHLLEQLRSFETVLFVYQLPNIGTVVVCEGLNILVNVEVFSPVVGFVLNMPYPTVPAVSSLIGP